MLSVVLGLWCYDLAVCFFFSSRRRHTRLQGDWSSDVCSSDLPRAVGDSLAEDHGPRPRRRRPLRARPAGRMTTFANARILTMDDAGTEHERGWLRVEKGLIAEVGAGDAGAAPGRVEDVGGAIVTPGLVNTHHHLHQTLTRARATEGTLVQVLPQ